jgi:hypothetical protein
MALRAASRGQGIDRDPYLLSPRHEREGGRYSGTM